jgi:hypothetical protein
LPEYWQNVYLRGSPLPMWVPVEAEKWRSSCKHWVIMRTKSSKFVSPFFWGPFMRSLYFAHWSLLGQVMHPSLWLWFSWPFVDACRWLYVTDEDIKSLSCFQVSESQSCSGAWICQWSWMNSEWLFKMFELSWV